MSSSQGSKGRTVQMFLTLKIKARLFFETSFTNYPATERNMWRSLEELNLQQHRYVNLNSTQNFPILLYFVFTTVLKEPVIRF